MRLPCHVAASETYDATQLGAKNCKSGSTAEKIEPRVAVLFG